MSRWYYSFLPSSGLPKTHVVICYAFDKHPPMPDEAIITGEVEWVPTKGSVGFVLTTAVSCVTLAIPHDAGGGTIHETTVPSSSADESFIVPA